MPANQPPAPWRDCSAIKTPTCAAPAMDAIIGIHLKPETLVPILKQALEEANHGPVAHRPRAERSGGFWRCRTSGFDL